MPFRFRKIISLGKGFRINLSKSGVSSSIGGKGFTLNIGKRGVRPTISAPGTGISYTPSIKSKTDTTQKSTSQLIAFIVGGLGILCIIIFCCIILVLPEPIQTPTPTPSTRNQEVPPIIPIPQNNCACSSNRYNCSDFSTHAEAQSCFDSCLAQGYGDIHKLDQDNDGNVCESLP